MLLSLALVPCATLLLVILRHRRAIVAPLPLLLLGIGWLLSALLVVMGDRERSTEQDRRVTDLVTEAQEAVVHRMTTYVDALRSGASFMEAGSGVTRQQWDVFAGTLDLPGRYPGINGIGVIFPVQRGQDATFEALQRAGGAPDFRIRDVPGAPRTNDGDRAVITYISPFRGNEAAQGLDVSSEENRRQAARAARDSGEPRMTRRITLVQDTERKAGFLLFVPVYRAGAMLRSVDGRRAAFLGWVYAPFITERFLNGVLGARTEQIGLQLYEGDTPTPEALIFSTTEGASESRLERLTSLTLAGERFTLRWRPTERAETTALSHLTWVGVAGAVATVWLVSLVLSGADLRRHVQSLVAERTTLLRQSELRYRELIEHLPEPTYVVRDDRLIYVNPAAATLFRAPDAASLLGTSALERIRPDQRNVASIRWHTLLSGPDIVPRVEAHLLTLDGEAIETEIQCTRIEYDGAPAVQVVARDLTDRRRAEADLRLRSAALDAAANAIVITDHAGVIEWVNRAFTTVTGFTLAEAVGHTPGSLLKSGLQDREFYERMWSTLQSGDTWRSEVVNTRKDGSPYPCEMTITAVRDAAGEIRHYIAVEEDITQRRRLEEQFRQAQKMESIGRLAGGVAHDFNNMLGVIIGVADLVLSGLEPDDPIRADLQVINDAAQRSAALTRQLLTFARKQSVVPEVLDVNDTVTTSVRMLQRLIGEHIRLEWTPSPEVWPVFMDPSQLDQIVANLTVNARDAIAGTGTIAISTANTAVDGTLVAQNVDAAPGDYVRLAVRDSGPGMSPEVAAHIFEPFFTTKGVGEGTGLGLSTVYGAVRQAGGFVTVTTARHQGTTFDIYLPRFHAQQSAARVPEPRTPPARGQETILLVEDEPLVLRMTERALSRQGYQVLSANSPSAALAAADAQSGAIDLLVTDVVMPGMSGRELATEFRRRFPRIRQIFISGFPGGSAVAEDIEALPGPLLSKPFTVTTLSQAVRKVLDA